MMHASLWCRWVVRECGIGPCLKEVKMTGRESSTEQVARAVFLDAVQLIKAGQSRSQVTSQLVAKGVDRESADALVGELLKARGTVLFESGERNMFVGALWFLGGMVVTIFTYLAARRGGMYLIAYGAILTGAAQHIAGRVQRSKGNRILDELGIGGGSGLSIRQ